MKRPSSAKENQKKLYVGHPQKFHDSKISSQYSKCEHK